MKISRLKIGNKINEICSKNVILRVFTKEYKEEISYYEFMKSKVDNIKLKSNNYDVDERIKLLQKNNFSNNYTVKG